MLRRIGYIQMSSATTSELSHSCSYHCRPRPPLFSRPAARMTTLHEKSARQMLVLALLAATALAADVLPAATTAQSVRAAAIAGPQETAGYPLPLAAHWNTGTVAGGFDPDHQRQLIEQGHHILPWFQLHRPDERAPDDYGAEAMKTWARLGLPISFIGTQWDVLVAESMAGTPAWNLRADPSLTPRPPPLSPASPLELWYSAGRRWGESSELRRWQELYPDPPLVLFISNNEQPKLSWVDVRDRNIVLPGLARGASDDEVRRAVGDAWRARYGELLRGFRDGLQSEHWRRRARFVGYEAFGQPAAGRWGGWAEYSLHSRDRLEPWSAVWDGASISYYTGNWDSSSDFRVWSPQVEAMNFIPMLAATRRERPDFWFEMSTWDGRSDELAHDKDEFYAALGQTWDPTRYGGMVQFGMWLLRPRVVREFRDTLSRRDHYSTSFAPILAAVDRVHRDPMLARFWTNGRLVANARSPHPYQSALPPEWQALSRWFLLDADANPRRPWGLETALSVYAVALELGSPPGREWLVYALSPLESRQSTVVTLVDGLRRPVRATRGGCFNRIHESGQPTEHLEC